jgi:hypothetical protein
MYYVWKLALYSSHYIINQGSPYPLVTLNRFSQELLLSDVFTGIKWSTLIKRTLGHEQLRRCFPFFSRLFAMEKYIIPSCSDPPHVHLLSNTLHYQRSLTHSPKFSIL